MKIEFKTRFCSDCKLYYASNKQLKAHRKTHKTQKKQKQYCAKRTAKRIISKRDNKVLAIFDTADEEQAEWVDESDVCRNTRF